MTLLPLVLVAFGGGLLAWIARGAGRGGAAVGIAALAAVGILAMLLPQPAADATLAGEAVALHAYARLFLVAAAATGMLVALLAAVTPGDPSTDGAGSDRDPNPAPAFLVLIGAATLALAVPSPVAALVPAAVAGVAGVIAFGRLPAASRLRGGRTEDGLAGAGAGVSSRQPGTELLRIALSLAAAVTALELLVGLADVIAGEPFGVGAALLALSLAVALRMGSVPFHGHAARLLEGMNRSAQPVLALWGSALFALVALAGLEAAVIPLGLPLTWERGVVAGLAVLTIAAGGVGALTHENLDQVVAYSILQDSGFVLLAFASTDPAVWGAARTWLLVLPLAKSSLLAWAFATGRTFGTRRLADLQGWVRRAPALGVALALVTLATIGLPGLLAFEARLALLRGALSDPIRSLVFVASLTSAAALARLFITGLGQPTAVVQAAPDGRLRRPQANLRRRVGATARTTLDLNRAPASAALVLALSLLAACLGAGLFGVAGAAGGDVPAVLPGPQPTDAGATFRPLPTEIPAPSARPLASPNPSAS